jgi:hypothetical protein
MATAVKFVHSIAIFLAYLIQLDVDVTGNITAKLCEVTFRDLLFLLCFLLLSLTNNVWRLIVFPPFLIIIKSPKQVWRLIVFAPLCIKQRIPH